MYSGKSRNSLKEIQSIHCFSSSKSERPCNCCKTSISNIMITLALDQPPEIFLLKYMDSKIIRKGLQSIKESSSVSLSQTD